MKWKPKYIVLLELTEVVGCDWWLLLSPLCFEEFLSSFANAKNSLLQPTEITLTKPSKDTLQQGQNSTPSIALWQARVTNVIYGIESSLTLHDTFLPSTPQKLLPPPLLLWRGSGLNHLFFSTLFLFVSFKKLSSSVISMLLTLRLTSLLQICLLICQVKMLFF